uniref:Ig-like domain-containing protein n=1 Tax=Oryzias melastigma TaxID=30732 RepID=A0A3B3DL21_ORYME
PKSVVSLEYATLNLNFDSNHCGFLSSLLTALPATAKVSFGRVDQRVTVECGISTNPTDLEWFHNEKRVLRVDRKGNIARRSNTRGSNLEINNLKKEDAGKFTCRANGKSGERWLYPVSVVVTPSGVLQEGSDASLQCEVHNLDQRTTVKWQRPDGSIINNKTVDFKPVRNSHGGTWMCEVTAEGGESFTTYLTFTVKRTTLLVNFKDHIGAKMFNIICFFGHPVRLQSCFPLPLGLHWWIWVALGASYLVLSLLIISVVLMYQRVRRKN